MIFYRLSWLFLFFLLNNAIIMITFSFNLTSMMTAFAKCRRMLLRQLYGEVFHIKALSLPDVNAHPIAYFQELLSCIQMHEVSSVDRMRMKVMLHAYELMKKNNITEYDDNETGMDFYITIQHAGFDDEIILRTKLLDAIMSSYGNDIDLRDRMTKLSFLMKDSLLPKCHTSMMLTAVRSYFTSEPDYQSALSIFDDTTRSRFFRRYKKRYREISRMAFRRILKSCGGNANAMSGFMHTVIEIHKAAHYNRRFADSFFLRFIPQE